VLFGENKLISQEYYNKLIEDHGPLYTESLYQKTPLMLAAEKNNIYLINLLISLGNMNKAQINQQNIEGETTLSFAEEAGSKYIDVNNEEKNHTGDKNDHPVIAYLKSKGATSPQQDPILKIIKIVRKFFSQQQQQHFGHNNVTISRQQKQFKKLTLEQVIQSEPDLVLYLNNETSLPTIKFLGDAGQDVGGVRRELIGLLAHILFKKSLFKKYDIKLLNLEGLGISQCAYENIEYILFAQTRIKEIAKTILSNSKILWAVLLENNNIEKFSEAISDQEIRKNIIDPIKECVHARKLENQNFEQLQKKLNEKLENNKIDKNNANILEAIIHTLPTALSSNNKTGIKILNEYKTECEGIIKNNNLQNQTFNKVKTEKTDVIKTLQLAHLYLGKLMLISLIHPNFSFGTPLNSLLLHFMFGEKLILNDSIDRIVGLFSNQQIIGMGKKDELYNIKEIIKHFSNTTQMQQNFIIKYFKDIDLDEEELDLKKDILGKYLTGNKVPLVLLVKYESKKLVNNNNNTNFLGIRRALIADELLFQFRNIFATQKQSLVDTIFEQSSQLELKDAHRISELWPNTIKEENIILQYYINEHLQKTDSLTFHLNLFHKVLMKWLGKSEKQNQNVNSDVFQKRRKIFVKEFSGSPFLLGKQKFDFHAKNRITSRQSDVHMLIVHTCFFKADVSLNFLQQVHKNKNFEEAVEAEFQIFGEEGMNRA
jgi:hypothetical protein